MAALTFWQSRVLTPPKEEGRKIKSFATIEP
jgi:hypothetical protein